MKNDQRNKIRLRAGCVILLLCLLLALTGCSGAAQPEKDGTADESIYRVLIENDRWLELLAGLGRTLIIVICSVVGGTIVGGTMFLWDYARGGIVHRALDAAGWFMLFLPVTTWLLIIYYLLFAGNSVWGMLAAVTAFSVSFGFDVYRNFSAAVGGIETGQREAACSMGYNRWQILRRILFPQALPQIMDTLEGDLVFHINDSSVVGFIAVQDIQAVADAISAETPTAALPLILTAAAYVLLSLGGRKLVHGIHRRLLHTGRTEEEIRARVLKGKIG